MPYNYFYVSDPQPSHQTDNLQVEHREFTITMDREFCLYAINAPIGAELDKPLQGKFTKIELAKSAIDEYLKDHQASDAFVQKDTKAKVGRPTNREQRERKQADLEQKIATLLKEYKEIA